MEYSELPEEILQYIIDNIKCREHQIRQLAQILCVSPFTKSHMELLTPEQSSLPSPSILVVHGVYATGKSSTISSILNASSIPSALILSRECITTRHLLERAIAAVKEALERHPDEEDIPETDGRCESISVFVVELKRLLETRGKFILVFDAIDRQREASPTLLPALARLGEMIPNLTTVLVVTTPHPHLLHHAGVPHLYFPPYTRAEILSITTTSPLPISSHPVKNSQNPTSTSPDSDSAWLWSRFTAACYDSLGAAAARDIVSFQSVCRKLWPPFVQPILDKDGGAPGDYWPREFSKLMVKNRTLFQSETALIDSIMPSQPTSSNIIKATPINLPYYAAYHLIATYIASHNPPRTDIALLSKSSLAKKRKRRRGATLNHSKNSLKAHQKLSRRLLGPQPFGMERLFAIFHAIISEDRYSGGNAEMMSQFATLVGLRLVVKAGVAGGGMGDALEGGGKWKCAVGWEFVKGVSRGVNFVLEDYIVE